MMIKTKLALGVALMMTLVACSDDSASQQLQASQAKSQAEVEVEVEMPSDEEILESVEQELVEEVASTMDFSEEPTSSAENTADINSSAAYLHADSSMQEVVQAMSGIWVRCNNALPLESEKSILTLEPGVEQGTVQSVSLTMITYSDKDCEGDIVNTNEPTNHVTITINGWTQGVDYIPGMGTDYLDLDLSIEAKKGIHTAYRQYLRSDGRVLADFPFGTNPMVKQ